MKNLNVKQTDLPPDQESHFSYRTEIIGFIEVLLRKLNSDNNLVQLLFDG